MTVALTRSVEEEDEPASDALPSARRATMRGSRLTGLVGAPVGAAVGAIFGASIWISAVVGFIVFAELPDLLYRVRARRGDTSPLLPAWDASEAYLVTLRRWRRSRRSPVESDEPRG
ncbi:MAG TPA: hypothetical protein VIJ51_16820 [Solirubrobacteraceae bacterium]